jgi:hypothetical protein
MTERNVPFAELHNFRDLGGYRTVDGSTVRWGRLYRSDDLARLAPDEIVRFSQLGIRTVIDLRRPAELEEHGRIPDVTAVTYRHVCLLHPRWDQDEFDTPGQRIEYVAQRYIEIAETARDGLGEALRVISDAANAPLVFHCLAGKDRTGVLAALTLSLLGVDDADVAADYALSESAAARSWAWFTTVARPDLAGTVRNYPICPPASMLAVLADLRERYGSIEGYAATAGVGPHHIAAMRAHLLERLSHDSTDPMANAGRESADGANPAVGIGDPAPLNVHETLAQPDGDRAGSAVTDGELAVG